MINYLVTGGTGFIGSNLVRRLVVSGQENIFLIAEKNANLWRLSDIMDKLTIFNADLIDYENIKSVIKLIKPNIIFHLASYGGLPAQSEQRKIFDINLYGTMNLLNECKDVGFECFINTGSSSEYGIKDCAMREFDVLTPVSDYGVSKAAATQFCLKEALFNKLPIYTIRPFSVYGDYEMQNRLIPTILVGALMNNQINLSSGSFVRDFIYIHDLVDIFLKIAEVRPKQNFIFNAGTGIQSTINDVVDAVEFLLGSKLKICWNSSSPRPWEPKTWKADTSNVERVLSWKHNYSLKMGLKQSLNWFEKNLNFYVKSDEEFKSSYTKSVSL